MTVAELIEALKAMPQDLPVSFCDSDWGDNEIRSVGVGRATLERYEWDRGDTVLLNDDCS